MSETTTPSDSLMTPSQNPDELEASPADWSDRPDDQGDEALVPPRRTPADVGVGLIRALRPHQWSKNLLLWLPLLLAHEFGLTDPTKRAKMLAALWAFLSFSLCASAAYVLNDLNDLAADRLHPRKRRRPFASGRVPLLLGPPLLLALVGTSAAITLLALPGRFSVLVGLYFALTLAYSYYFKRKLLLDVVVLSGLYTLRIIAGAAAVTVPLTAWLLAFSMFFFLCLAFAKRYTELMALRAAGRTTAAGRDYHVEDLGILPAAGLASGYLSVLVFALYINDVTHGGGAVSGIPRVLYTRPHLLWLICPVLLYWVTRLWFLARRGTLHDDPVVFAMEDRVSWLAGAVALVLIALASAPPAWGLRWLP